MKKWILFGVVAGLLLLPAAIGIGRDLGRADPDYLNSQATLRQAEAAKLEKEAIAIQAEAVVTEARGDMWAKVPPALVAGGNFVLKTGVGAAILWLAITAGISLASRGVAYAVCAIKETPKALPYQPESFDIRLPGPDDQGKLSAGSAGGTAMLGAVGSSVPLVEQRIDRLRERAGGTAGTNAIANTTAKPDSKRKRN